MLLDDLPQDFLEFNARFGTDDQCREYLFQARWPDGFRCSSCGHGDAYALRTRLVYECVACGKQHSLLAGTLFEQTKTGLARWFLAIYLVTSSKGGIAAAELQRQPGFGSYQTAWSWLHKLRKAMVRPDREPLAGRVEADESYVGGPRPGKRGRGAAGKTPFVAAVETTPERKPRRLRLSVVKGFRKKEVEKLAKRDLAPGTNVVSDGLSCWSAVEKAGCEHFPMATGSGKRAAGWAPFRWVNTALGNIKTAIAGTYHHVSPKHAPSYLASHAYRFDRRRQLDSIVERLAWAAVRTAPHPYRVVTADT